MAIVRTHNHPEIAALQQCIANTLDQIDCALDRRDRRQFKVWCGRRASLSTRLSSMLLALTTDPVR